MSEDLRELYQEVILDHSRHPRHFGVLDDADLQADGHNPLCGDRITVFLRTRDDGVEEATFHGSGCAISMASASMMTEAVRGATSAEIDRRFQLFHDLVTGKLDFDDRTETSLRGDGAKLSARVLPSLEDLFFDLTAGDSPAFVSLSKEEK